VKSEWGKIKAGTTSKQNVQVIGYGKDFTTRNPLIHDEIPMTFFDFVTDHTASMTNSQISSEIRSAGYEARYEVQTL
jgi:hypothetical protein